MSDTDIDDSLLDEEWLAAPHKRSRLRTVLVALLAAAVCVLGGAELEKHVGSSGSSSSALPTGLSALGGQPGGLSGSLPSGLSALSGGGASSGAGSSTSSTSGASTSVIGTVVAVHGNTWIVKDLGGARHTITVSGSASVVRQTTVSKGAVKVGTHVDVSGSSSGGRLTASEITLR